MICVCVLVMDTEICNFVVSEEGRYIRNYKTRINVKPFNKDICFVGGLQLSGRKYEHP